MADQNIELLREIAALLKQSAEDRPKTAGNAVDTHGLGPDWKKRLEEMDGRTRETREKAEQYRQEGRAYQQSVLLELRKISSLLEQMQRRSGGAG
jgi:hypothetical protein